MYELRKSDIQNRSERNGRNRIELLAHYRMQENILMHELKKESLFEYNLTMNHINRHLQIKWGGAYDRTKEYIDKIERNNAV